MDTDALLRRLAVAEVVANWAVWRDAGDWARFRTCWRPEGRMFATWCQAPAEEFVRASEAAFARGVTVLHTLHGTSVEVAGRRAVAQTKMTILQRGAVGGVACDVACTGRFYDLLEEGEGDGRWGILVRQPIFERDRLDPVDPGGSPPALDRDLLARYPEEYRHLALIQTLAGFAVKTDMPVLRGPKVEVLYAAGARWLRGEPHGWEG
jgi:hypothetical protein